MRLVVLLIYTSWTFTHMFSSKYLLDQPINNILFASVHGHNDLDSKWSLTHEWWKGFSCRDKDKNIFLKTSWCYCQLLLSVSSFMLMHECIFSMNSDSCWVSLPPSLIWLFLEIWCLWLLNSGSLGVNVVSKELRLDCGGRTHLLSMSSVRWSGSENPSLIQYHTGFDNGEIS